MKLHTGMEDLVYQWRDIVNDHLKFELVTKDDIASVIDKLNSKHENIAYHDLEKSNHVLTIGLDLLLKGAKIWILDEYDNHFFDYRIEYAWNSAAQYYANEPRLLGSGPNFITGNAEEWWREFYELVDRIKLRERAGNQKDVLDI